MTRQPSNPYVRLLTHRLAPSCGHLPGGADAAGRRGALRWPRCSGVGLCGRGLGRQDTAGHVLSSTGWLVLLFVLPIIDEVRDNLDRKYIEQFCRKYSILSTDISFKFRIIDDITRTTTEKDTVTNMDIKSKLITALSTAPEKGILNIDVLAIHPIAEEKQWSNSNSIHSYKPEEFISRIINVHDKDSTSVYDVLFAFREGSNIRKNAENQISIAELLSKPDKDKRIERLYHELKKC